MDVETLFPTHLATVRLDDAAALNAQLLRDVAAIQARVPNQKPQGLGSSFYTTFPHHGALHRDFEAFARLGQLVHRHTAEFGRYLGVDETAAVPLVPECWLNIYGRGDFLQAHCHPGYHVSAVYYVEAPADAGPIAFFTPLDADHFFPLPCVRDEDEKSPAQILVRPEPGTLLLFRSWLRHAVRPSDAQGRRVSIAFNAVFVPPNVARSAPRHAGELR